MYMGDFEERRNEFYKKTTSYESRGFSYQDLSVQGQLKKFSVYKADTLTIDSKIYQKKYIYDRETKKIYDSVEQITKCTGIKNSEVKKFLDGRIKKSRFVMSLSKTEFLPIRNLRKRMLILDCNTGLEYRGSMACGKAVELSESAVRSHLSKKNALKNIRFYYCEGMSEDEKKALIEGYKK